MEFIYRSAFVIGITLLVPVMMQYLTAKSKEDDTAVYTVQMRTNMMKILKIMVIICPAGSDGGSCFFRISFLKRLGKYVLYRGGDFYQHCRFWYVETL